MRKRFAMIGTLGFAAALLCGNVYAQLNGAPGDVEPQDTSVFGAQNRGAVVCTAAVNSTGQIVGGANVNKALNARLALGAYDVRFTGPCGGNIKVSNGFARYVQVDTLTTGSISGVSCTTADRAGAPAGIFVLCTAGGSLVDTSFLLSVTR